MARVSLWQRVKRAVTNFFSGGGGSSSARRVVNNPTSRRVVSSNTSNASARRAYLNAYKGGRDDLDRQSSVKDSWAKTRDKFKADTSKSEQNVKSRADARVTLNRIDKKANVFVADSNARNKQRWENKAQRQEEYKKATNYRYDVEGAKNDAERLKRRQAVKSRAFNADTAVAEQKYAMKHHKKAESFARGATSGATFGASDLLAKYGTKGEAKKAEKVYQKNKSKGWETAGEVAGNLAAFGLTSGASKKLVGKVAPKATAEVGAKVAKELATTKLVRKAAEKEVANAVKKGLAKEVTEEAVERVAKQKAKETVANLAEDAAINLTTGKVDSAVRAIKDTKGVKSLDDLKDSKVRREVEKNFLKNDVANIGIGSVATVGLPAGVKAVKRALGGVSEGAENALKGLADEAPKVKVELNRRRKTDVRLKNEEPKVKIDLGRKKKTDVKLDRYGHLGGVGKNKYLIEANNVNGSKTTRFTINADRPSQAVDDAATAMAGSDTSIVRLVGRVGENGASEKPRVSVPKVEGAVADDAARPQTIIDEAAEVKPQEETSFPYEGTPEAEAMARGERRTPPRQEISVDEMAGVDEPMPSTNPRQTAINEATEDIDRRVEQIAEEPPRQADDGIKVNKVSEDAPISEELPSGVKQVRSAYEYNNGEEPKIEGGTLTRWNESWKALNEYSASHAKGEKRRMSKVGITQLNAMDSDAERELRENLVAKGLMDYDAISTPEMYDKIAKQMRTDADRYVKEMIDINEGGALDFRSTPEWQARVQYIMGTIDPSADEASEIAYTEAFKLAQNISSKSGQTLNLRRNFVHLTPMGKRDAILDDLINILQKSKGFSKNHPAMRGLERFDKREYIRKVLTDDEGIMNGVEKLVKTDNPDEVGDAFTELMYNLNKKNPKTGFDVLQEIRYLNMLGNIKTHGRNVFGSTFFIPIREASNSIRSLIEQPIEKWATKYGEGKFDVARHGGLWTVSTPEAKQAADEAFKTLKNEVLGSAKYETVSYKGRGKTKVGKAVDWLSDFNSTLLAKEDDAFRTRAFKNSYAKSYSRYMKDGVPMTEKIKRKIEQEALRESQIATFNEYNSFANFLNNISRKANDVTASTGAKWGGRALNAVMPFTKVPANLMNQSLNYSPLGIARGMANIKTAAQAGDSAALNAAIDQLSSGLTGSAVFGLGMLLGKTTDMFTTNTGKNDPAAKFKKDRGMQNYSVTFKDPETGKGYSFTLDWLVPASATFFSGVEMANQLKSGDFNVLDIGGDWSNVVTRLAEPVMETSMLSGLHGMLETMRSGSRTDDDKGAIGILLRETVQSYMNSLIPTVLGQAARTAYKTDMQVVGDTDWDYWRNQAKLKAGLANTNILGEALGADTDAYGNVKGEKKSGADYAKSALKNFLSPANIQKVDFSAVDNEKLRIYEEAVKNGADPEDMAYLFPKKQYKKEFDVAGEKIKMSNRDVSTYNQAKATGGAEGMRYILENVMFNRRTTDEKGKNVPRDDAYTQEMKDALINQFDGKSMREVEEWLYAQPEFKSATDAEKEKAINGLWTLENPYGNATANASRRVGEQAVYKAQGKDVNEYNFKNEVTEKKREALMPAIAAGILTYEQIVDFDRNAANKGYYENESGGEARYTYSQESIMKYLSTLDASEETKKALYDAYYTGKQSYEQALAKQGKKGKGRRRRGGYRRRSGGGRSAKPVKTSVPIKASDFKASKATYKDAAKSLPTTSTKKSKASKPKTAKGAYSKAKSMNLPTPATTKVTPPKVKFKKYEI